jgi:hypothetical protein
MADDKNIEMVGVEERNSSKEGSVENGVAKSSTEATQKGVLEVYLPQERH